MSSYSEPLKTWLFLILGLALICVSSFLFSTPEFLLGIAIVLTLIGVALLLLNALSMIGDTVKSRLFGILIGLIITSLGTAFIVWYFGVGKDILKPIVEISFPVR